MVLAGAGSGKTRVLTTRVAYLMAGTDRSECDFISYLTNKAAGEMTERVRLTTGKKLQFSGTFHKLCAKILRVDGHHIGIPVSFAIYDDEDQIDLVKKSLKILVFRQKRPVRG